MLELKNICYTVSTPETGEQTILKDISVTIPDGKLIVFTGPNGGGKTTLLRACIRALSNSGERVCVCDDRGEISAMTDEGAQFDLGPQTDVLTGVSKSEGMMLLLRAMSPTWIAADEITARRDLEAMEQISYCGVRLLATAHAKDLQELRARPLYRELLSLEIFKLFLVLQPDRQFLVREAGVC